MQPSRDQIEKAAYHRWERRGGRHGDDRDDWAAAEKDLRFALNYRWLVRRAAGADRGERPESPSAGVRPPKVCRFCERAEPLAGFADPPIALPGPLGALALDPGHECDECKAHDRRVLAVPFEAFAGPLLGPDPVLPRSGATIGAAALKALARLGLLIMPEAELSHFGDTLEWVANPDHDRDSAPTGGSGLGCQVYVTPVRLASPFASLARRASDDSPFPYMLFFLGAGRVVFQTSMPFSPRDEDLDDLGVRGPLLSMSVGEGDALRESAAVFVPAEGPRPAVVRTSTPRITPDDVATPREPVRSASARSG